MNILTVAKICHEANRVYCESIGDFSQKSWNEAEDWQRESAIKGVDHVIANPSASASDQHDSWLIEKKNSGWVYGPEKNTDKKTHPCIVPYNELPFEQKVKDYLFKGIVLAFINAKGE